VGLDPARVRNVGAHLAAEDRQWFNGEVVSISVAQSDE
jgi:hypothetical protein